MGYFAVYNLRDDVHARSLFSMQADDDVFADVYKDCVARVNVEEASWQEEYKGPGMMHEPYLQIKGKAVAVFLENYDQRIFPCGSKELVIKDITNNGAGGISADKPLEVRYHWHLETDEDNPELPLIISKGFYLDEKFPVPANLVGNIIELPCTIRYMGVYDSPIAGVEILDAENLHTCTRENGYYGLFEAIPTSERVEQQRHKDHQFYQHLEYDNEVEAIYSDDYVAEDQVEDQVEVTQQDDFETAEDRTITSVVQEKIVAKAAEQAAQRAAVNTAETRAITDRVQGYLHDRAVAKRDERETSLSDAIFGTEGTDQRDVAVEKATYADFKAAVLAEDARRGNKSSMEMFRQMDTAIDNQMLNAGNNNTAGFASAESVSREQKAKQTTNDMLRTDVAMDNQKLNAGSNDTAGFTSANDVDGQNMVQNGNLAGFVAKTGFDMIKQRQDEKSGKAQLDNARTVDAALDNQALNDGGTDIAGQGASASAKKTAERVAAIDTFANDVLNIIDAPSTESRQESSSQSPSADDDQQFL